MGDYVTTDDDCCEYDVDHDGFYDDDDDDDDDGSGGGGGDFIGGFHVDSALVVGNSTGPSIKVINKDSLLAAQREDMDRVMDLLSLKEHHARTLLIFYRWDIDKVMQLLVEIGKDKLYAEAGVTIMDQDYSMLSQLPSMVQCNICFNDVSANEVTAMDCGHFFCNGCWTQHFIVKINGGQSRRIRCMEPKCNAVCHDAKIRCLVSEADPNLAEKFDRFLLESYIEDNRRVKWCPSVPHCGNAIQVEDNELYEVECACGEQFCFSCSAEAHSPCPCLLWELWSKKCKIESETVNWITVHTKTCPKCGKPVEKNGGCNLVCCVCGQSFCWLCGGATGRDHTWTDIVGHSCGRYKDDHVKNTRCGKTDLERYIHYHNRYKAHLDSFKLESKLKEAIQGKISTLENRESTSKDFSWLKNGLHRLFRARRILSLTYPFAYYMFGDEIFKNEMTGKEKEIKKSLFEDQQQQFEANVEKLSSLLAEEFGKYEKDEIMDLRMKIIAVSVSTDNLCRNLYDCIENDLLGSLKWTVQKIAPYRSKGVF